MKELYIFGEAFGLPSIDPQCLALIAYLNVVLPNEYTLIACNDAALSPTGELPMLYDGKNWIAGTNRIITYLSKTGHDADEILSRESKAKSISYQALIDETLTDALLFSWFADSENFVGATRKAYSSLLSFPGRYYIPIEMKKKAVRRAKKYGGTIESGGSVLAHAEHTEIYDAARKCYGVLCRQLGEQTYFFGTDKPTTLDAKVFGYLALQLYPEIPNPRFRMILTSQYPRLVEYCDRYREEFLTNVPKALPSTTASQISNLLVPTFTNPFSSLASWTRGNESGNTEKSDSHESKKSKEKPAEQRDFERKRMAAVGLGVLAMIGYVIFNGLVSIKLGDDEDEDGIWLEVDEAQTLEDDDA
ncbi:hypothetical protein BGZ46_001773 [Entomortierella lignicola]|nr:hypothetical protein BGZ46_001773 [Entomortierella lignicola]